MFWELHSSELNTIHRPNDVTKILVTSLAQFDAARFRLTASSQALQASLASSLEVTCKMLSFFEREKSFLR